MMDSNLLIYVAFGILFVIVFVYMYAKDSENNANIKKLHTVVEELIDQNHYLRNQMQKSIQEQKAQKDALELYMHQKVQDEINQHVLPLLGSLRGIEDVIQTFQDEQQDRLSELEQRTKSINRISPPSLVSDDKKVIQMYKDGKKEHEIAKELRIGLGEVQFILRMNNLK